MAQKDITHEHSRYVTIFRTKSYLEKAQKGPEVESFMAMTKQPIGSYFETQHDDRVGTGLEPHEIDLLLSKQLMMSPDDREFMPKVKDWYQKRSTEIPYKEGRRLQIGLQKGGDVVSADNLPINLVDYLLYRHAKGHPHVAKTKEEADGNQLMKYYIFDKHAEEKRLTTLNDTKDEALKVYIQVSEDPKRLNAMLILMGIDPRKFVGPNAAGLRKDALRELASTKPADFINTSKIDSFEERYAIKAMIMTGVLKVVGNSIVDASNPELVIGHNEDEAVVFFKNPANSQTVVLLRQSHQEAAKKAPQS